MPPRNLNIILIAFCVAFLCYVTHRRVRTAMMVGDALEMINMYYVDPVDDEALLTAAMNGMTATLDQHSEYIPGKAYQSFQDSINQEFAGIGIFVEHPDPDHPVRVITPLVNSPALKAGIKPGDLIIRVDNEDVSKLTLREVSDRLRGAVQTVVHLVVLRGENEIALSVKRDTIPLPSVIGDHRDENDDWVYRIREEPSIAYIRLTSFGEKTVAELEQVLADLDNDFRGLVLDLRGNGGGLLQAAADVCDMFLDQGRIVSTRTRGGVDEDDFRATHGTLVAAGKPVAILIDGNSASASEIVAACLQDHDRAAIVGTRSYGKGTVQNILPLQYGRSALRLTVARYYRPNGKNIHRGKDAGPDDQWGVSPTVGMNVEVDEETLKKMGRRWREASYPAMATQSAQDPSGQGSTQTPTDSSGKTPEIETESDLWLDPQLGRAAEYLRQQSAQASPAAEAA